MPRKRKKKEPKIIDTAFPEPTPTEEPLVSIEAEVVGDMLAEHETLEVEPEPEPEPTVTMTQTQYNELTTLLDSPPSLPAPENRKLIGWLKQVKEAAKV